MKKIVSLILAIVLAFGVVAIAGCNSSSATMPNEGEYTRVAISTSSSVESMELSSSVEFMIDDKGLVVSAAPLNENGALLLAGDTFEGMTPGEAIEHVIYTAIDLGFLVKSAVEGDQNSVDILVSGTSLYAKELESTNGNVHIDPDKRLSVLKQNQNAYDAYTVMDTVIMGNQHLYDVMKERTPSTKSPISPMRTVCGPPIWRRNSPKWAAGKPNPMHPACCRVWASAQSCTTT